MVSRTGYCDAEDETFREAGTPTSVSSDRMKPDAAFI